jgi:hypothetical protein
VSRNRRSEGILERNENLNQEVEIKTEESIESIESEESED